MLPCESNFSDVVYSFNSCLYTDLFSFYPNSEDGFVC
jgi:hypothetical protein